MAPVGELFRATISVQGAGGLNQNVLHFRGDTGVEDAGELLDVLIGSYWPAYREVVPTSANCLGITVQQLTPVVQDPISAAPEVTFGQVAGAQENAQVAAIMTLRTGFASRRKRGRVYLAPVPTPFVSENVIAVTARPTYQEFIDEIMTTFGPDTGIAAFTLCVYSRLDGGDGPVYTASAATPVTAIQLQLVFGAQRRRRLGRGA